MSNKKHKAMLSEHFSLEELTYSRIAVENGLDNEPPPAVRQSLCYLAVHLLEPLGGLYNSPIAVLSGYRSDSVNRLAGGVVNSQHRKGEAADCYIPEGPCRLLDILKKSGLLFDQAILYKKRNFLHLSLKEKGTNRMQILFYILCLVFLLPSCQIRRGSTREEHAFYIDSLVASGKDSSLFNR
ncbi:D-Ala-D-Ala carboxypeptidase family metallohydrolase, partial [Parabacteroides goldsteinii]